MARKTFRERILRLEEAAWVINNEVKELKALYSELEEENVRLTDENRVLRLQVARLKKVNNLTLSPAHGN